MDGLEDVCIQQFIGISNLRKMVKSHAAKLQAGDSNQQYLVFQPVTQDDLTKIDRVRHTIGKDTRVTHYIDKSLLIIKLMPSAAHGSAHLNLAGDLVVKMLGMGMARRDLRSLGGTRFDGRRSSKEGDSVFMPRTRMLQSGTIRWPTIVFESGLSETLHRLRCDANWWLETSKGEVKIVIIISIKPAQTKLHIERWERAPLAGRRLTTRASSNNPNVEVSTKMQEVDIDPNGVIGAPLILEFQKVFLRQAVPPEGDFIFTAPDLASWAADFWEDA
jgi:hypothetical protein